MMQSFLNSTMEALPVAEFQAVRVDMLSISIQTRPDVVSTHMDMARLGGNVRKNRTIHGGVDSNCAVMCRILY